MKESELHRLPEYKTSMQGRYVCFYIEKGRYGIILDKVIRIIRYEGITGVPKVPPFVEGVINLRGDVIPVINVRERFGLTCEEFSKVNRIIVINHEKKNYGLLVDSVKDIYEVREEMLTEATDSIFGVKHEFITGIANLEEGLLVLLDISKIVSF